MQPTNLSSDHTMEQPGKTLDALIVASSNKKRSLDEAIKLRGNSLGSLLYTGQQQQAVASKERQAAVLLKQASEGAEETMMIAEADSAEQDTTNPSPRKKRRFQRRNSFVIHHRPNGDGAAGLPKLGHYSCSALDFGFAARKPDV
jgi:hypothetical protein